MDPVFWQKYRKRILNHHILKEWQSPRYNSPKDKIHLQFEHFMIFNILTSKDFFHGIEGKGEEKYFFAQLKGNNTLQHPFHQQYFKVLRLQHFFKESITAKPWCTVDRWNFERYKKEEEQLIAPFSDHHNSFEWGKMKCDFYKLMNEEFTIIEQKYKKSLDIRINYAV